MDIHKPKPWHGTREFGKELATIVLGVLIALGAEQAVEWLHMRTEMAEARAAMQTEIRDDLRALVSEAREDACYRSRMVAFAAWAGGAAPRPPGGGGMVMEGLTLNAWEMAKTGALPHMPLKERLAFAAFYADADNQMSLVRMVRQQAIAVGGYRARQTLRPEEAAALIRESAELRSLLVGEARNVTYMLDEGRQLGLGPDPEHPQNKARVDALCAAYPPEPAAEAR
jgi:hypothetical protein